MTENEIGNLNSFSLSRCVQVAGVFAGMCWLGNTIELGRKVHEVFTITEKAPTIVNCGKIC